MNPTTLSAVLATTLGCCNMALAIARAGACTMNWRITWHHLATHQQAPHAVVPPHSALPCAQLHAKLQLGAAHDCMCATACMLHTLVHCMASNTLNPIESTIGHLKSAHRLKGP
jgi:hypothetical protein